MTSLVIQVSSDIYCYWNSFLVSKMQLEKIFSISGGGGEGDDIVLENKVEVLEVNTNILIFN